MIGTKLGDPGGIPPGRRKLLCQVIKEAGLISESQIEEALSIQRVEGGRIGQILCKLGYVVKEEILITLSVQKGVDIEELDDIDDLKDILDR